MNLQAVVAQKPSPVLRQLPSWAPYTLTSNTTIADTTMIRREELNSPFGYRHGFLEVGNFPLCLQFSHAMHLTMVGPLDVPGAEDRPRDEGAGAPISAAIWRETTPCSRSSPAFSLYQSETVGVLGCRI